MKRLKRQGGVPGPGVTAADQDRPELQDPDSQAILQRYGNDPGLPGALQVTYGERAAEQVTVAAPPLRGLSLEDDRLAYAKSVGWGTVANDDGQYKQFVGTRWPYPGLDWSRDGCSAPDGLGLGYREDFRPVCNVYDSGYRNRKVLERTDANRKATDAVFHANMDGICAAKSWHKRPACYAAAYAYYEGVRVGGASAFVP